MRAKTKKNLIIQLILIAILLPVLFVWNPGKSGRILKPVFMGVAAVLYVLIDRVWKWKEADEDEKPLWFEEKKTKQKASQQEEEELTIEEPTLDPVFLAKAEEQAKADRRSNMWLLAVSIAILLVMIGATIYHVTNPNF